MFNVNKQYNNNTTRMELVATNNIQENKSVTLLNI